MMKNIIEERLDKGEQITCPKCGKTQITALRKLYDGDMFFADYFEPVEQLRSKWGNSFSCPKSWCCREDFVISGGSTLRFHTAEGLKP